MPKTPSTPKTARSNPLETSTKKSVIEYRSTKDITNLYGALGETERSIADMTRIFAELPSSGHMDVGGSEKLTTRQQEILSIISQSQRRAEQIVRLIKDRT